MNTSRQWFVLGAVIFFCLAPRTHAVRYEVVPEDETILFDDTEAIVMAEYVKRANESIEKKKARTAAAQLRRVALRAGRAADLASGEARGALLAVKSEALRLAYAAETRSDSAKRRIGEFAKRLDNFISGEWALLEAKHYLARGDFSTAKTFLTLAGQQMKRRAKRTGKDEGKPFEEAGKSVGDFMDDLDILDADEAATDIAVLIKTARELKPAPPKKEPKRTTSSYSPYRPSSQYGTSRTMEDEYDSGDQEDSGYDSRYGEEDTNTWNGSDTESSGTARNDGYSGMDEDESP